MPHDLPPKFRVLVVEDEEDVRRVLVAILEEHYEVVESTNGLDALVKLQKYEPDLFFVDIMMPIMDGYELMSRIRATPGFRDAPIVMISALDSRDDIRKGYSKGASVYLTKPLDPQRILKNVEICLQEREPKPKTHTLKELKLEAKDREKKRRPEDTTGKEWQLLRSHSSQRVSLPSREELKPKPPSPAPPRPSPEETDKPKTAGPRSMRPTAPPPERRRKEDSDTTPETADSSLLETPRVMVVDDDEDLLTFIEVALEPEFEVVTAQNGMEALQKIPGMQPDLYVIDAMMPKMSGYQLVEVIQKSMDQIGRPIIFISAKNSVRDRNAVERLGVTRFMPKPFDAPQLRQALAEAMETPGFSIRPKKQSLDEIRKSEGDKQGAHEGSQKKQKRWQTFNALENFLKENKKKGPFER